MWRPHPMVMLVASVVAIAAFDAGYVLAGMQPSELAEQLSSLALGLALVGWVESDALRRRRLVCHDFGFLIYMFLPTSLLCYVFWSRGWRGFLTLVGLLGILLIRSLLTGLTWLVLYGQA